MKKILGALRRAIRRAVEEEKPLGWNPWNLKIDVWNAFEEAWAPKAGRVVRGLAECTFPNTSRGRHWLPRRGNGIVLKKPGTEIRRIMPSQGYWMDDAGTIRKIATPVGPKLMKQKVAFLGATA